MLNSLIHKLTSGDERSAKAKKNIIASFFNKGLAIVITLLLVPVTIGYLDSEQYGIWLTLSSIVAWISYFDVGLGHGFRNRFAEAKAKGEHTLARKYVTTSYATLFLIFGAILIVTEILTPLLNWSSLLKVTTDNALLIDVVSILLLGSCVNFVLHITGILLSADQRPALSAIITTIGQGFALATIYVLTLTTDGNMRYLAVALSWIPCLVLAVVTVVLFRGQYKAYAPSLRYLDFSLVRNIIGLGGKFFVIQLSMLVIFQLVNIILSRVLGPEAVTEYNVSYKYFSVTQMIFNIILSPYWSAYTEAYTNEDYDWMKRIYKQLTRTWLYLSGLNLVMLAFCPLAYQLWLGDKVEISWAVSIAMCIYLTVLSFSNMYMILLNGIGKVMLQMYIYVVCAIVSIPCTYTFCGIWGIPGVLAVLSLVYILQAAFAKHQLNLILHQKASGIWNK